MSKVSCYLFNNLPAAKWSGWTLAVFATSMTDARNYIKAYHREGKFIGEIKSGKVQADCGAVTASAQLINSTKGETA